MSKRDEQIEQLEAERDHWRRIAHQRAAENADLLRQIERLTIHAGVLGIDSLKRYDQAMAQLQIERDQARALLNDLIARYGQVEFIVDPQKFDTSEIENADPETVEANGGFKIITEKPGLHVGYIVAARNPIGDQPAVVFSGGGMYLDSVENFQTEITRLHMLIWRAPMLEDLRGMDLFGRWGISDEQKLKAIQAVSIYWHDEHMRGEFASQLDRVFKEMIAPLSTKKTPKDLDDLREAFLYSVRATHKQMSETRQLKPIPSLPRGRRPKNLRKQSD